MNIKEEHIVFTIGRQYGSGGRYIGKKLAEYLDIPYLDKELLEVASKESGLHKDVFENADEAPRGFLNSDFILGGFTAVSTIPINDTIFNLQAETITSLAQKGSCVIVGRCANYILKDMCNVVNVFIHSTTEDKIRRIVNFYNIPEEKAVDIMKKQDKKRQAFYNYYSDNKWGVCENYDISINTAATGIEGAVKLLTQFADIKLNHCLKEKNKNE